MKKTFKRIFLAIFVVLVVLASCNIYKWIVSGEQSIKIGMANKAYTNEDLYISIVAQDNGVDLETKTKVKFLDPKGKEVKDAKISYEGNNVIISVPNVNPGNYSIKAKVSSKEGKDTITKDIYISDGNLENIIITLDKGIYKPGDIVNFRALLTNKDENTPIEKDVNICIYDGNNNKVFNENAKTSDYGIISGNFTLANEVNSGIYKLVVKTKTNETTKQFKVNPYVTPKYEVNIEHDKERYLVGDKAKVNINSKYFFGEPVADAKYTVYLNNSEYEQLVADKNGNATFQYDIKKPQTYNVKVEAVDTSNYFVEKNSSVSAGTDIFEIELLPEFGSLVDGMKNDIYVFTKNSDNTPIKTYITANIGAYTKQVITDENGIGKFSIDVNSIENTRKYYELIQQEINIIAENMSGEKVTKSEYIKVTNKNLLLSTDKAKYNQNEDINIEIFSDFERAKNIYIFKNDKLIKMLTTDSNETVVNLGNEYGLIDIYVKDGNYSYKRTIFIKPSKELKIAINKDKEEYAPGENISLSFETADETNTNVNAALLVSMLDNAILNLANNDLSIDNVKLALSDINFSNELDAATLYSCIMDDSSEQTIMALLLKQSNKKVNVSETNSLNYKEEDKAAQTSIILIVIIIIMVLIYLGLKFPKAIKHILNFIIILLALVLLFASIIYEFFWRVLDFSWITFIIITIASLICYIEFISKISEKIYKTSLSIIITCFIMLIGIILYELFDISFGIIILAIMAFFLIMLILSKFKNSKINKLPLKILSNLKYIFRFILAIIATLLVRAIINEYIYGIEIIALYIFNYLFNKPRKEEEQENKKETYEGIIALLALIIEIGVGFIYIYMITSNPSDSAVTLIDTNNIGSITPSYSTELNNVINTPNYDKELNTVVANSTEKVTDNNIRQLFLESMCFIPELITKDGKANLDLKLSDNITTWTIQTIGNTKDGRVGFGSINDVKVFKDFFVDFELPKNSVETDKVSIPVTIYNYTNNKISTTLKIKEADWFALNIKNNNTFEIEANSTKMMYIPITILKSGNNAFRVEVTGGTLTDIVEKTFSVTPNGYKVEKVVSTGNLDGDISEDILILDDIIENTASAKVKIYASTMSQTIEGMENIFRMPTGCFEQISSSLYPNILALKYMEENNIVNDEIRNKAISYISSGYQKLLAYEVKGESGGYSLYGYSPAETVLTAYGLMELTDLSKVYDVDENVLKEMNNFLYRKQKSNGSFTITGSHMGGISSRDNLAMNAYITWALSESDPDNTKLNKSVEYLKNELDNVDDNYTLSLIANVLANVKDGEVDNVIKRLVNNVNTNDQYGWITSNVTDYYGSRGNSQTIQTVALTSMALSKTSKHNNINKSLINYLINKKDTFGTWYSTQATILSLKALNTFDEKSNLEKQTITVKINSNEQKIEIKDDPIELYELKFNNLNKENKLNIDIEKGNAYYEVVEEYYVPYENTNINNDNIEVSIKANTSLKVNEILDANITTINRSGNPIYNGMITISIPQGFTVVEDSLMELESKNLIEKYEMSYTNVNLYLRNFGINEIKTLDVKFRASYPVEITGLSIRAYDYYNPEIEGKTLPMKINVAQ